MAPLPRLGHGNSGAQQHRDAQPLGPNPYFLVDAFEAAAASPFTALLQRYETRLQLLHQRALRSFKLLRTIETPQQDSPSMDSPFMDSPSMDNGPEMEKPNEPEPPAQP